MPGPLSYLKQNTSNYDNYNSFVKELCTLFGHLAEFLQVEAEMQPECLKQTAACLENAMKFDQLTATLGFNNRAKLTLFCRCLKPHLQTVIAGLNQASNTYGTLHVTAIRIDQQLFFLCGEKTTTSFSSSAPAGYTSKGRRYGSNRGNSRSSLATFPSSKPRGPVPKVEKERHRKNYLCLYCGSAGHTVTTSPASKCKGTSINATLPPNIISPATESPGSKNKFWGI
jgi:hypothetical protein